jgi:4-alpha-glucanotransferase
MPDLLRLGPEARMNTPGTAAGNWAWGFDWDDLPSALAGTLRSLVASSGRAARVPS